MTAMSNPGKMLPPGAYKFQVKSTTEAVALIREKLGPTARVISVNAVKPTGFLKFFKAPRLEVVAQIDAPAQAPEAAPQVSSEPALPPDDPRGRLVDPRTANLPPAGLAGLLRRSGLTETALNRLQSRANWNELNNLPLHRALAETSRLLCEHAGSRSPRAPISRAAFLGAPGVGRTTALCKWLSIEVFRRERQGHIVTVEFDQPNPLGPLPVFSEALGIPIARFPCETRRAVENGFVYFDLPGISTRRAGDNARLAQFLDAEQVAERVLVLNGAYDRPSLREAYAAGKDLGATHLAFTHLDEVSQWGKLWDYLFDEDLEPLFLSTGPSLTGEWEEDVPGAIARRTLPET
jgi:flagellar biosynthesis protein FlhF